MNGSTRGLRIYPPITAAVYLVAAAGIHHWLRTPRLIPYPFAYAGIGILLVGLGLNLWTNILFQKRRTTRNPFGTPTAFIMDGPYVFSRNPMYLSVVLMLLGIGVWVGTAPFLLTPVAFLLTVNAINAPLEESELERTFGDTYRAYRQRVRRWL